MIWRLVDFIGEQTHPITYNFKSFPPNCGQVEINSPECSVNHSVAMA